MYHVQLSEFPPCHTGPVLSFSVSLFLHRDNTDRPRWIAKLRESESTMTLLVKLMWSGHACTLPELLATRRVLDESVVTGSELTVVISIRAWCSLPHDVDLVSRWWQAYTDDRSSVCVGLHNPLLLQPPNSSCRQHTVQYSDGFENLADGSQSTQFQDLASCFENHSELRRFPSSLVFSK